MQESASQLQSGTAQPSMQGHDESRAGRSGMPLYPFAAWAFSRASRASKLSP